MLNNSSGDSFFREESDSSCETRDSCSDSFSDESESEKLSRWDGCSSEEGLFEQECLWPLNDRLGNLYFQYFERSAPYGRVPLMDKVPFALMLFLFHPVLSPADSCVVLRAMLPGGVCGVVYLHIQLRTENIKICCVYRF